MEIKFGQPKTVSMGKSRRSLFNHRLYGNDDVSKAWIWIRCFWKCSQKERKQFTIQIIILALFDLIMISITASFRAIEVEPIRRTILSAFGDSYTIKIYIRTWESIENFFIAFFCSSESQTNTHIFHSTHDFNMNSCFCFPHCVTHGLVARPKRINENYARCFLYGIFTEWPY